MNKTYAIIAFVMLILFTVSASALSVSDVQFGDSSQDRNINITKTVTITNNGPDTITNPQLSFNGIDPIYKLMILGVSGLTTGITLGNSTLVSGASATVTLQAYIPTKLDAVDSNTNLAPVNIGSLAVTGTNTSNQQLTNSSTIYMQAKNELTISAMTMYVNGESQSVSKNERIDNLKPGDKIQLDVTGKNQYSDRLNVDVAMSSATVTILSSNTDIGVDDQTDLGSISPRSDSTASFTFTIPQDLNDGSYDVNINLVGTDDQGGKHGEHTTIFLRVVRDPYSIAILKAAIQPSEITCDSPTNTATVDVTVNNMGQHNEDAAAIEVSSPQFKYDKKITDLLLNKGKSKTQQFSIDLPDTVKSGTYHVDVTTFYQNTLQSDTKSLSLKVDSCEPATTVVTPPPTTVVQQQPQIVQQTTEQQQVQTVPRARVSTTTQSFTDSALFVYLLAGIGVLLVLLLFVMLIALASSRRRHDDD